MTDWTQTKPGDEVNVPGWGIIKLTAPVRPHAHIEGALVAPGFRWIKSKQKFSGNALLSVFRPDQAPKPNLRRAVRQLLQR
jgi:hypothetical protein